MREITISVARDFSRHPGPRYIRQGPFSGEKFRQMLVKALKDGISVVVDLDGTSGFGSSFLDEAFGGLIRSEGMKRADVLHRLRVRSELDVSHLAEIRQAIELAQPESKVSDRSVLSA